ncbi:MAG: leucine-rich repeat domain-containing protein [Lachnospiraceae bacterium]|nr:leucine-rich repeat domain-containing protein [Lachnospiraceae bacterium]
MIRVVKAECPNCGATLKRVRKDTFKCAYCNAFFLIDRQEDKVVVTPKETNTENNTNIPAVILFFCFVCILSVVLLMSAREEKGNETEPVMEVVSRYEISSPYFISFVEQVFGKNVSEVTRKELATIKYLRLRDPADQYFVDYRIGDGEIQTVEIKTTAEGRMDDIRFFSGLEELDIGYKMLSKGQLDGLKNLIALACGNTPKDLLAIVPKTENIKSLNLDYSQNELEGIDKFVSLERLMIDNYNLTDLTLVSELQNLKELSVNADALIQYESIKNISGLETLYIESDSVRDLSFLNQLTNLRELEIRDTEICDIRFLEDMTTLKKLRLDYNNEINDFMVIEKLTELEELMIYYSSSKQGILDFSKFPNLKSLEIYGIDYLQSLQSLTGLEKLKLHGCSQIDLRVVSGLPNLKEIQIYSNYGDVDHFEELANLPSLEILDMRDTSLLTDISVVFQIPTLKELYLTNSKVGVEVEKLKENNTLKVLDIGGTSFITNINVLSEGFVKMANYDSLAFSDLKDALSHFSGLEELYVKGNKIETLDFIASFPKLKVLDITDNYIKDLTPLLDLPDLQIVYCKDNPISQEQKIEAHFIIANEIEPDLRY